MYPNTAKVYFMTSLIRPPHYSDYIKPGPKHSEGVLHNLLNKTTSFTVTMPEVKVLHRDEGVIFHSALYGPHKY